MTSHNSRGIKSSTVISGGVPLRGIHPPPGTRPYSELSRHPPVVTVAMTHVETPVRTKKILILIPPTAFTTFSTFGGASHHITSHVSKNDRNNPAISVPHITKSVTVSVAGTTAALISARTPLVAPKPPRDKNGNKKDRKEMQT